jgi:hypothetical protein
MTTNIYKKLLEVQKEIEPILKDKNNPYFKSKYADINAILGQVKPILNKHGLVVTQPLSNIEGKLAIKTIIADSESGEHIGETTVLPEQVDPQKAGSAITYFRRYALQSILALEAEDDDGNIASGKKKLTDEPPF